MRKHKFIISALIIVILCIGIMFTISRNNKSMAANYSVGQVVTITGTGINPDPESGLYCIEYGPQFTPGKFVCYEGPTALPSDLAYVLGHVDPSDYSYYDGTFRTDIRQNYLWEYLGNGSHVDDYAGMANDIANLKAEADIVQKLNSSSVSIKPLEDEFIKQNAEGKYGPFVINYPSVDGKWVGDSLKVTLNDKELTTIPESGKEFYLTEADGIKFGEKNILEVSYYATQYEAEMYMFAPEQDVEIYATCPKCGENFAFTAKGFVDKNDRPWLYPFECPQCQNTDFSEDNVEVYVNGTKKQHVGIISVYPTPIHLEDSVEFWVGRKIVIDLNKTDNGIPAQALENIEFEVEILNSSVDKTYILKDDYSKVIQTSIVTDKDGKAQIVIITYEDNVRVQIQEKYNQYYIDSGPIVIDFAYDDKTSSWTPTIVTPTGTLGNLVSIKENRQEEFTFDLNIINKLKIEDLKIIKINSSVPGEYIAGITFRITLDNAVTEDGQSQVVVTTDANGEISVGILEIVDPTKNVTATIEEIGVPTSDFNFKGLYPGGEVTITIWHADKCNTSVTGAPSDTAKADYDIEKNIVTVEIKNEVTLDLAGKVWQDGQTGLKPVVAPNNIQDASEKGIANIKVVARKVSDNSIVSEARTDSNGDYIFKDLPASVYGNIQYSIEFTYDGINYIAVTPNVGSDESIDSDATEIDRTAFNNKFATIVKDNAVGKDGKTTPLKYDLGVTTATLQTMNGIEVKEEFAMVAETSPTTYNKNTTDIDLGLVNKGVDLAAVTDIYSAKVTINGEEKTYTYNDIISLNDNIAINTDPKPNYSLYLYNSDYNYRIGDYTGLGTSRINDSMNPSQSAMNKTVADEINVELTYRILLNNQSATDATINQIAYYYDPTYILDGATPEQVTIDGKTYNKVIYDVNQLFTDTSNQGIFDIVFTVDKDALRSLYLGEKKAWVEITSYSTDTGCIDIDSAPDNILTHKTEDDTDDARGLNITINSVDRTISGYVFEDTKSNTPGAYNTGNGTYEEGETKINDVIVQLIEVKEVGNSKLEYIWQETVSGSNTVKYITTDGKNIATYNVSNEQGQYTFKDFIPGDYIIRFIYGDGTCYDNPIDNTRSQTDILANITKYNGQDYKSTVDMYYNINIDIRLYPENNSMARDNEARRLEEMAYATSPDRNTSDLIIDGRDKLNDTWMCAETSTMEIPVSDLSGTDSQDGSESSPNADLSGGSKLQVTRSVNFGLVERPQANLELEKHVTLLKISGNGTTVAKAEAEMDGYSNDKLEVRLINKAGENVYATATDKAQNQRGTWLVQTQVSELENKKIEINYTYRVYNIGDADYIGPDLNVALNREDTKTVSEVYQGLATNVKYAMYSTTEEYNIGRYLGTTYYSKQASVEDVPAEVSVKIEDYINGEGSLIVAGGDFSNVGATTQEKSIWNTEGNEAKEQVQVVSTSSIKLKANGMNTSTLKLEQQNIDTTSGNKNFTYRSYVAQLVAGDMQTSETGTLIKGSTLNNLEKVQSYAPLYVVALSELVPQQDESIAETVQITIDTGGDKQSPVILITAITGGLVLIAVCIVLIKKFVIK